MGKVRYLPNQQALERYYQHQRGHGVEDSFFAGPSYQRGHGLEGIFGRLLRAAEPVFRSSRSVAPVLKKAGKALAKESLAAGVGVANDLMEGKAFGSSVESRLNKAANRMANKGAKSLTQMLNASETRKPATKRAHKRKLGRKTIKRKDIFG